MVFLSLRFTKKRNVLGLEDWLLWLAMLLLVLGDIGAYLSELRQPGNDTPAANEIKTVDTKGGQGFPMRTLNPKQVAFFLKVKNRPTFMTRCDD